MIVRETPIAPAFDLELTASGSMQPGKPIQLHVRARANMPVKDAEISLVAPDFEAARMSGFGAEYTLPVKDTKLPRLFSRRGGWSAGQSDNHTVALTVPAPGYYRVVASVTARSELPLYLADDRKVGRETFREIWLRVDKRGGRATLAFDSTAMPREAEMRPGPMRCHVSLREEKMGKKRDPGCDGAAVMAVVPICDRESGMGDCTDPCTYDPYGCQDPCEVDPASCAPSTPPLQPLPYHSSICPVESYYAEYYTNPDLAGSLRNGRCEATIRNDWEGEGPAIFGIGADNFSVRWTGWRTLQAGTYTFTARADDGVRLWVDNELLIDQWRDQAETNYRVTRELAGGTHHIRMEYYERGGLAAAQLSIDGGPYGASDPCFNNGSRCFQFLYYHAERGVYTSAPEGMRVKASYQDRDCFGGCWWNEERAVYHRADAEGRVILPCPASRDDKRLRTHHEFLDEYVAVGRDEWLGPEVHGCDTGWDRVEIVPNREAWVYGNMRKAGQRAEELFGRSSDRVRVDFDAGPDLASWYDLPAHHISLLDRDVWAADAAETHGHEYGHSYHHRALGGISHIYLSGYPSHNFHSNDTGDKALLEGFATFFSTLVLPGTGDLGYFVRHPEYYTRRTNEYLPTGQRVEGRVAAYLWDLVDDALEKGSDHEVFRAEITSGFPYYWGHFDGPRELFDAIQFSPRFVGDVLIFCRKSDGGQPEDVWGVHQCVEARTPTDQRSALHTVMFHDLAEEMP